MHCPMWVKHYIPILQVKKLKLSGQETSSVGQDGARIQTQFRVALKLQLHHRAFHEMFLSNQSYHNSKNFIISLEGTEVLGALQNQVWEA